MRNMGNYQMWRDATNIELEESKKIDRINEPEVIFNDKIDEKAKPLFNHKDVGLIKLNLNKKILIITCIILTITSILSGTINFLNIIYYTRDFWQICIFIFAFGLIVYSLCANICDQLNILLPRYQNPISENEIQKAGSRHHAIRQWSEQIKSKSLLFLLCIFNLAFLLALGLGSLSIYAFKISLIGFFYTILGVVCILAFLRKYPITNILSFITNQNDEKTLTRIFGTYRDGLKNRIKNALQFKLLKFIVSVTILYAFYSLFSFIDMSIISMGATIRIIMIISTTIGISNKLFCLHLEWKNIIISKMKNEY